MSVAAVDVGSNSVRLLVLDDAGERVLRRITTTRLAEGVDRTGVLADAAVERTVAAIADLRGVWTDAGVPTDVAHVRIAATSAVRDAADRDRFLAAVEATVGIPVDVIDGEEEASLGFAGASGAVPTEDPCVVVDVGGGSTELVVGREGEVLASVSTQLGCVRLTERALHSDPVDADERAEARAIARRVLADGLATLTEGLAAQGLAVADLRTVVAVAGTATTLAALDLGIFTYEESRIHGSTLTAEALDRLTDHLLDLTVAERAALGPVQPGRAEVLHGGAIVLATALHLLGRPELVVSEADSLDALATGLPR